MNDEQRPAPPAGPITSTGSVADEVPVARAAPAAPQPQPVWPQGAPVPFWQPPPDLTTNLRPLGDAAILAYLQSGANIHEQAGTLGTFGAFEVDGPDDWRQKPS